MFLRQGTVVWLVQDLQWNHLLINAIPFPFATLPCFAAPVAHNSPNIEAIIDKPNHSCIHI
ncbi:hypothetical protein Hanom_Chr11g01054681 [Helianthus anomalus]